MGFIIALFFIGGLIALLGLGPGVVVLIMVLLLFGGGNDEKE